MGRKKKGDIYPDINDEFAEFETEEEKKEKKKQKKAEEDDVDCLPKVGFFWIKNWFLKISENLKW